MNKSSVKVTVGAIRQLVREALGVDAHGAGFSPLKPNDIVDPIAAETSPMQPMHDPQTSNELFLAIRAAMHKVPEESIDSVYRSILDLIEKKLSDGEMEMKVVESFITKGALKTLLLREQDEDEASDETSGKKSRESRGEYGVRRYPGGLTKPEVQSLTTGPRIDLMQRRAEEKGQASVQKAILEDPSWWVINVISVLIQEIERIDSLSEKSAMNELLGIDLPDDVVPFFLTNLEGKVDVDQLLSKVELSPKLPTTDVASLDAMPLEALYKFQEENENLLPTLTQANAKILDLLNESIDIVNTLINVNRSGQRALSKGDVDALKSKINKLVRDMANVKILTFKAIDKAYDLFDKEEIEKVKQLFKTFYDKLSGLEFVSPLGKVGVSATTLGYDKEIFEDLKAKKFMASAVEDLESKLDMIQSRIVALESLKNIDVKNVNAPEMREVFLENLAKQLPSEAGVVAKLYFEENVVPLIEDILDSEDVKEIVEKNQALSKKKAALKTKKDVSEKDIAAFKREVVRFKGEAEKLVDDLIDSLRSKDKMIVNAMVQDKLRKLAAVKFPVGVEGSAASFEKRVAPFLSKR